ERVARDVEARLAAAGEIEAARRLVLAAGEHLHRLERVRRAAHAEVDLDRDAVPVAGRLLDRDEVDRDAADDAGLREDAADLHRVFLDAEPVDLVRGELAAEVGLAVLA